MQAGDFEVVKVEENGVTLRRPYEEGYWSRDSDFEFRLLDREIWAPWGVSAVQRGV